MDIRFKIGAVVIGSIFGLVFGYRLGALWFGAQEQDAAISQKQQIVNNAINRAGINNSEVLNAQCINNWLVIHVGTYASLYARDKNFKPIPCILK